jgi:hypothetical protein
VIARLLKGLMWLLVGAVLFVAFRGHLVACLREVRADAVLAALAYALISLLGFLRLRQKPKETRAERRMSPRRRALPPAPGGTP